MIIFSKSLPGGPYHRISERGFMDQRLYKQWFDKTFIPHAVTERPLLLIQDGATYHMSGPLIRSAIANDVIMLSLSSKTTHITQPLDVSVFRKIKIKTSNL
jgi:hypothetical protein